MNNVPFWWVIRGSNGYARIGWAVPQSQAKATRYYDRPPMSVVRPGFRVVRVHARIRDPKLPAWVQRVDLGNEQVAVVRVATAHIVSEYVFHVDSVGRLAPVGQYAHTKGYVTPIGGFVAAPSDVWAEAAARAAKMLRARKAKK